jgi:hypothetical protein
MKQVTAFETSDGKIFHSEKDAMIHEATLDKGHEIDLFLLSEFNVYRAVPQKMIARTAILNWETWKENHAA